MSAETQDAWAELEQFSIVALTGATGFIGSRLTRRLVEAGWRVRVLVRPAANLKPLAGLTLECIQGSLEDPESLNRLVHNAGAVIHCAGAVRGTTQAQFDAVNVAGLARLVEAAMGQRPPPRFLLLSSLAARTPTLSAYAASKRHGERVLMTQGGEMRWFILRPPAVYGPGDRELLPLLRAMAQGFGLLLGPREARVSLLYVDDLTAAVEQWLNTPNCPQGVYALHDGHPQGYSWSDIANTVASLQGKSLWRIPVAAMPLQILALLSVMLSRLGGYAPMLTPGKIRELRHCDWVCDNTAVSAAIGWAPRVSLLEGLGYTLNPIDETWV